MARVVLVTGSSAGIGAALCREFHRRGCVVAATARNPDALAELASEGMLTERLDVNDSADIARAVEAVAARAGRIDVLVNNAGYGLMGPAVELSDAQLRAQMETNLIAPLAMTRAVAPIMRAHGGGMIVNIGSISGVVPTPFSGAYCASKAALHALSDALRMELSPFRIRVVTVQPGSIQSGFGAAASQTVKPDADDSWYHSIHDRVLERANMSQPGATANGVFARQLVSRLLRKRPPAQIRLGKKSLLGPLVKNLLPRSLFDKLLAERFGLAALRSKR